MKTFILAVVLIIGTTIVFTKDKGAMKAATVWPADKITWVEVPNTGGVKRATLWGNPDKGASGVMYTFPAGTKFPLHYHTSAMKIIVFSGTLIYTPEGGSETLLGPGSYLAYGPKDHHISGTVQGAECTFFAEQTGKFDMVPLEKGK